MSKKSIFSFITALILVFSLQSGIYAEKETEKETTSKKTETVDDKKTETDDDEDDDDRKSSKKDNDEDEDRKSSKKDKDEDEDEDEEDGELGKMHTDYYLLADLSSGKVLEVSNGDEKVYPASTTKILTGIIALEKCKLKDVVTATKEAIEPIDNKHSNMGILVDEKLTVEQLLYGLLVGSANDAANVLAVHIAGDLDSFAEMMNEKAKDLGAKNTNFINAHGFHDDDHYTTVNDLAKISYHAMKNETFRKIVSTAKYEIPATNKYRDKNTGNKRYLANTNLMISSYKGAGHLYNKAIGVKTGHTDDAGYCLVAAAAEKDGTELLSVVMKCDNGSGPDEAYSFIDSRKLLEYGFENYKYKVIADVTDIVESATVKNGKTGVTISPAVPVGALLAKDVEKEDIDVIINKKEGIKAPVKTGDVLGEAIYKCNGEVVGKVNLVAGNDVKRSIIKTIGNFFKDNLVKIIFIGILIFILYAYVNHLKIKKRRARRRMQRIEYEKRNRR